jgi:hypothetical protein
MAPAARHSSTGSRQLGGSPSEDAGQALGAQVADFVVDHARR